MARILGAQSNFNFIESSQNQAFDFSRSKKNSFEVIQGQKLFAKIRKYDSRGNHILKMKLIVI